MKEQYNSFQLMMLGLQHMLAMYAGAILVPLIVGAAIGLNAGRLTYLIAIDLFMCGTATLLRLWKTGTSASASRCARMYVYRSRPDDFHWRTYGVSAIYGAIIAAGLIVVLAAGFSESLSVFSACRDRLSRHDHRHQPDSNSNE